MISIQKMSEVKAKDRLTALWHTGPALILLAAMLWAFDGVLRRSLFTLPPVTIVFFEHCIGMLILTPFVYRQVRRAHLDRQAWILVGIISFLSGLIGTLFFTTALVKVQYISFSVVFLLQKLQPLFAIGAAAVLLREKITRRYIPWAVVAIVAAYFVTFPNGYIDLNTGGGTVAAAVLATGAAAAWGTSTVFSRMLLQKVSHWVATWLRFTVTTVLAFGAVVLLQVVPSFLAPDLSQLLRLVIIALSTGMVALVLYYRGLARTEAKISTILELAFPVLAVFLDVFLYQTMLLPSQYVAAGILLFAMYRVSLLSSTKVNK